MSIALPHGEAIEIGAAAPDFLVDGVSARERFQGKPIVLAFFSTQWDPARFHQLALYNDALSRIDADVHLLSLTCDQDWCEAELSGEGSLRFPILTDLPSDGRIAERFGVSGGEAVFVIDPEGIVRWRHVGPSAALAEIDQLAAVLRSMNRRNLTRRQFMVTAVATMVALTLAPSSSQALGVRTAPSRDREITLNVNGRDYRIASDPRTSVLDALRERIGLTGTKKGCDHGQCGACTVLVNGRRVNSCLMLAAQAEGDRITTVEGLAKGQALHPVQEAFIKHDGFQCGYCTSGQIMSAVACIAEGHTRTDDEIREWMSGNICRCGAYEGICDAIKEAKSQIG